MNEKEREEIKNTILGQIKSGEISMKSKTHFVLKTFAYIGSTILASGFLIYIASFIVFLLRINGILLLPSFGSLGIIPLLFGLPWILILLVGALILVLEILGRHFAFVYKRPLIYSALGVIVLTLAASVAIGATAFHDRALESAREHRLPVGGPLYRHYSDRPFLRGDHIIGTVTEITEGQFVIINRGGEDLIIATSTGTKFPRNATLQVGDTIIILGAIKNADDVFEARGIRKFDGSKNFQKIPDREGRRNILK